MPETAAKYIFVFKFVFIFVLIRLCLTPGVLIRTYSYYFLTQFSSFLFVRVTKKNGQEFQSFYIRPHSGVDSG